MDRYRKWAAFAAAITFTLSSVFCLAEVPAGEALSSGGEAPSLIMATVKMVGGLALLIAVLYLLTHTLRR
jgi:hypothetical protein